jgi:hypothetical protein
MIADFTRSFQMKRNARAVILSSIAASLLVVSTTANAMPAKRFPPAVQAFLDRSEQCEHWAGEEPYDEDRRKEIDAAFDELHCESLAAERQRLQQRYRKDAAVTKAIEEDNE